MKNKRLQELDHSNFEIVNGEPDIRGWDVRYRDGEKIGSVEELILDTKEKKVRYMIVDLDENELRLERRKILVPIGMAELDRVEDDVLIPNISVDQICELPVYERNNLTADTERRISSTLGRKVRSVLTEPAKEKTKAKATENRIRKEEKAARQHVNDEIDAGFYDHEHYNLDNLYKNRLHEARHRDNESEFDRSLRLWERRSEGGLINEPERNLLNDEERSARVRNRRNIYRDRRYNNESV